MLFVIFHTLTQQCLCLAVDNVDREHKVRTFPPSAAAAGRTSLRLTDNRQIQNNKRQSPGAVECSLTYLLTYSLAYAVIFEA